MKRRDFLFKAGVAGTVGAAAAGVGFPAIAKGAVEWRMQSTWRRNSPLLSTGPDLVADYVNKASGGRMKLKVYTAGEVVGPLEVFDAVADGTLHMGHGYPAFWSGKHPGFQFLAPLPFGMTSQEQNAWFAYGGGQALIDQLYGEFGLKFFPSGNTSVQGIWLNKDINAAADFKGMKIRTGALAGSVLQAFGAVPVQLPLGEVTQALQNGTIDGADYVGPFNDMAFGLPQVARNYYWPGWMEPNGVLDCFVNQSAWDKLDSDLKEVLVGANAFANQMVLSEFVAKNAKALQQIKQDYPKVNVTTFNADTLKSLKEVSRKVVADVAKEDALAGKIHQSMTDFMEVVRPYSEITEMEYMNARAN
ncbi:MAG: ABC transporter substrate-binding protein [Alcanivorax sp.]|nr:ABC transporter substrate-binding protein [Alcanivorax sp.]MAY11172.1 ABC transporter substrate-binding protein [Alcanivorax sp.]MBI54627.1 ABC transporter substrate-binding protein [Alcanivorax sp.]MBU59049.1 ABC transporter substrate-binding protein [Alcanivorax sp.]MCQ6263309.1 TRAP transporter substrate-binding protein [Alcanivorax sp. MM125-6]|tara:strand:- start:34061 stop:35143 length:1083 start_codon:yes stop_codon:yes gene_type:complete